MSIICRDASIGQGASDRRTMENIRYLVSLPAFCSNWNSFLRAVA